MSRKIIGVLVCLITILQLSFAGICVCARAPVPAALLGAYTSDCARVDDIVVSSSPLGEQLERSALATAAADIFYAMPELGWSFKHAFKPVLNLLFAADAALCASGFAFTGEYGHPLGRSPTPVIYFILFAVILALSNLPAPAYFIVRSEQQPGLR